MKKNIQTCLRNKKTEFLCQVSRLREMLPEILRLTLLLLTISITFFKLLSKVCKVHFKEKQLPSVHLPERRGLHRNRRSADYRFSGPGFVLSKLSVEFEALARMFAAFVLLMAGRLTMESTFADY